MFNLEEEDVDFVNEFWEKEEIVDLLREAAKELKKRNIFIAALQKRISQLDNGE